MKVGVLTSSRADFGIYLPLLRALRDDVFFELEIIAFGTHLSDFYGRSVDQITALGFQVSHEIESMLLTDTPASISCAIGLTMIKFSDFWKKNATRFDFVFCLGDRYEMFAAVSSGVPFNVRMAHIHGGETTLGAIDNVFRHSITLASSLHFVSTDAHGERVAALIGTNDRIYNVGALGLDNVMDMQLLSIQEFQDKWGINLGNKTILVTFHPETIDLKINEQNVNELIKAINSLSAYQFLITMPNADTAGSIIRSALKENFELKKNVYLIENLGSQSYFTAMKYASFLLGNTSSGIIEAASFNKYVINLGNRQLGRSAGDNVLHIPVSATEILAAVTKIELKQGKQINNIYWNGGAAAKIIRVLKNL